MALFKDKPIIIIHQGYNLTWDDREDHTTWLQGLGVLVEYTDNATTQVRTYTVIVEGGGIDSIDTTEDNWVVWNVEHDYLNTFDSLDDLFVRYVFTQG